MFTKIRTTMLALAAVASLGIASLATTTSADARGFGGGGFSRGGGGGHIGMRMGGMRVGHIGGVHRIGRVHIGHRIRIAHRPHFRHIHLRPHWCHRFPWRCKVHVRWPRPIIYGAAPVIAAATYAAAPVAAPAPRCTCLTKEYTPEGLVVFQDVCTKEVASAPVGTTALPAPPATTTMPLPQSQTELQQLAPQVR